MIYGDLKNFERTFFIYKSYKNFSQTFQHYIKYRSVHLCQLNISPYEDNEEYG